MFLRVFQRILMVSPWFVHRSRRISAVVGLYVLMIVAGSIGYEGVLLFFEGGTWRWPTIRLGYERQVLPGVTLRTVALRPALFDVVFEAPEVPRLLRGVVEASEQRLVRSETERREEEQVRTSGAALSCLLP